MLKITLYDGARELRLRLEGKLSGPWVAELRQCWQTASSTTQGRKTVVDLQEVDFVDAEGQSLLADLHREGVRLVAATPFMQALLGEVARVCGCGRVKENPRRSDALVRSHTRPNPRAV